MLPFKMPPAIVPGKSHSDLTLFIDILQEIRTEKDKDFYDIITNPSRACITGSSVLGKRVNKPKIAKDIDIFIDNRGIEADKIIRNFFNETKIKEDIWPVYKSKVLTIDENPEDFTIGAHFIKASPEWYVFDNQSYDIKTYKLNLGQFIQLNFILLDNLKPTAPSPEDSIKYLMTRTTIYPFSNDAINKLIDDDCIDDYDTAIMYSSFILEYIEKSFDFQELKYIYDFETKSYLSIYEVANRLSKRLLDYLTTIESSRRIELIIKQLNGLIPGMALFQDEFKRNFSNPDVVTISHHDYNPHRFSDIRQVHDLNPDRAMSGDNLEQAAANFSNLRRRVKQYKDKGFQVEDPGNVLVELHTILAASVLGVLVDPDITSIERQAIFGSSTRIKKNYQFLNRLRMIIEENENKLGLDLVRPGQKDSNGQSPKN